MYFLCFVLLFMKYTNLKLAATRANVVLPAPATLGRSFTPITEVRTRVTCSTAAPSQGETLQCLQRLQGSRSSDKIAGPASSLTTSYLGLDLKC